MAEPPIHREDDYLEINRRSFDELALEFEEKIDTRVQGTQELVNTFVRAAQERGRPRTVLEVGPGSGYVARLLLDQGFQVTCVEFSPMMAEVARRTAPGATLIVDEFLKHDFDGVRYDCVLAIAFIHLFPHDDRRRVMGKLVELLAPQGLVLISTTEHALPEDGYRKKSNFRLSRTPRYRHMFTHRELQSLVADAGLCVLHEWVNADLEEVGKRWMNLIATQRTESSVTSV
jgi:2-polyprenyl-3-methyl-5-hydroxy-6-metoxy-1,4-benzoquinol methylase